MSSTGSLVCVKGHTDSPWGSRFCIRCGGALSVAPPTQSQPAPQPQPAYPQPAYPQPAYPQQVPHQQPYQPRPSCPTCGGSGARLAEKHLVCPDCKWLRPLAPGYAVDPSIFQWAEDGVAMATLRSTPGLTSAARAVSDQVGRRWIESTFNAVRLGPTQLPDVWNLGVTAARLLGMPTMPDLHVSGERAWDALTFGSENSAFVILGSALTMNFQGDDLLFILAREMGHCRAGHALWKTVIRFLVGEQGPRRGVMAGGVLNAVSTALNPAKLMEGALELPLLAWARQAEITADRAGLLAVGDEATARRALLGWSLKNPLLLKRINTDAWLAQQAGEDGDAAQMSELLMSSTPYLTRRLKHLEAFARSRELVAARTVMQRLLPPRPSPAPRRPPGPKGPPAPGAGAPGADALRFTCPTCKTAMRIPKTALAGKESLSVKCPNPACGKVATLKKSPPPRPKAQPMPDPSDTADV